MVAPWQETQFKVVVEFKKSSSGAQREVVLTHSPDAIPPQLIGRVTPEVWGVFMTDLRQLAHSHPYTSPPNVACCADWLFNTFCFLFIGFGCFKGDSGDYGEWLPQLEDVLNRHRAAFAAGGAALRVGHVHGSFWVQIDIDPQAMAVGAPVPTGVPVYPAPANAPPNPYPYQKQ